MIKVCKKLYALEARKTRLVSSEEKVFECIYDAYKEAHLQMFYMPNTMELSLNTCEKKPRELAVFFGMEGSLNSDAR